MEKNSGRDGALNLEFRCKAHKPAATTQSLKYALTIDVYAALGGHEPEDFGGQLLVSGDQGRLFEAYFRD